MRVGELAALAWGDVDEAGCRFRVKQGKTASARRWVAVPLRADGRGCRHLSARGSCARAARLSRLQSGPSARRDGARLQARRDRAQEPARPAASPDQPVDQAGHPDHGGGRGGWTLASFAHDRRIRAPARRLTREGIERNRAPTGALSLWRCPPGVASRPQNQPQPARLRNTRFTSGKRGENLHVTEAGYKETRL